MSFPHSRRRRRPLVALLMVLAVLVLPAPAFAVSECITDAAGDVEARADGSIADVPEADILAVCTAHGDGELQIAVRVDSPTDPQTDEGWADFRSAVGAALDVDGDGAEEFDVNYGRFPDGTARVGLFDHDTSDQIDCATDGRFDGVRYVMTVPTTCLGGPDEISVAAFIFYTSSVPNQDDEGFYDEVPARPEFRGPFATTPDPETAALRLSGASRVDTAIAVSQEDFTDGGAAGVVLARADIFPDALVAAPLAVAIEGPLLLTPSFAVAQVVEDEIQRVLPAGGTVYLSGGTAALSDDVRDEIEALGYTVVRVSGASRYATAVEVARTADPDPSLIVVADGNDFPDALVGGSLAAAEGGVEILSNGGQLDATAQAYLDEHPSAELVAIGAVAAQAVPQATAIVGEDPFQTSVLVAQTRYPDATAVGIASGTNFPDGLTGGTHAGRLGMPLLLSWPDVLPTSVQTYLEDTAPLSAVTLYGGTAAMSHQIEADAAAFIG